LRRWTDRKIRTHFFEPSFRDAFDRQKILDFSKGSALLADIYNCFRGARTNSRYLLELFRRRGVQINRMCGRVLCVGAALRRGEKHQQNRENE
jgi:hypothetical protein